MRKEIHSKEAKELFLKIGVKTVFEFDSMEISLELNDGRILSAEIECSGGDAGTICTNSFYISGNE